jgi:nucleotide-binding universal stress UspA family protein
MLPEFKTILYATDLSENAYYYFEYAVSIAKRYDARIIILHTIEDLHESATKLVSDLIGEEKWKEIRQENEQKVIDKIKLKLEKFCQKTLDEGVKSLCSLEDVIVKIGNPVEEILLQSNVLQCDMVVMGSHGKGRLAGVMMGSTSRRVTRRCKKPVLIIRRPDEDN